MKAFVLSGGANLGAEQAGMLEALLASGIAPDVLVGTSIGAANAAFLASDPTLERARMLSALWRHVRPRDVFPLNPLAVVRSALGRGALFPAAPWRRVLEREIPYARVEEAAVPLRIVATSFDDASEVVFDRGPVVDAVMASTAIPGIFPPHEIDGRLYLDGGLVDQIPLTPACEQGADTIYVLSVGFPCPPPANRRSARALFMHSVGILLSQRVRLDGDHLPAHHGIRVVQIPSLCTQVGLRDFSHSGELIERAREQTARFLAAGPGADGLHEIRQGGASPGLSLPHGRFPIDERRDD